MKYSVLFYVPNLIGECYGSVQFVFSCMRGPKRSKGEHSVMSVDLRDLRRS